MRRAILLIDHGSSRARAHDQLVEMAARLAEALRARGDDTIVEIAHMELAAPSIAEGLEQCVSRGAELISAVPCLLSRGRHVSEDIPEMLKQASAKHSGVRVLYASPLAEQEGFIDLLLNAADTAQDA